MTFGALIWSPDDATPSRGQTLPDFAVGIAVFLITIAFVAVFVPQLVLPFEDQEQPVVAERISSDLGNEVLTDGQASSGLNESATRAFFDRSEDDALEHLGVASDNRTGWYALNVTLRDAPSHDPDSTVLCADPDPDDWIGDECGGAGDRFAIGQPPPDGDSQSVTISRRALFTADRDVILEVTVW